MDKGLIQVYTGDGKGKTTAALGLALRAVGSGMRVLIIQFLKGREYGELIAGKALEGLRIIQSGLDEFVKKEGPSEEDIHLARQGIAIVREAIMSEEYDLVILDEVNIAVSLGVLRVEDVLPLIDEKPDSVELVLTGRNAPPEILERADLITEMKNIRHYYEKGIKSRKGIEW